MKLLIFVALCLIGTAQARITWARGSNGAIPNGAFVAGSRDGRRLYLCRALFNNHLLAGELDTVERACIMGNGGRQVRNANYDVAVGTTELWQQIGSGGMDPVPRQIVIVGHTSNRTPVYACRRSHFGNLLPGRIEYRICVVTDRGQEYRYTDFQVLLDRAI